MALLTLITYPDPRLKFRSEEVTEINDEVRRQLEDMLDTMYAKGGIGLAGVQVGILKRILVMDIDQDERGERKNPLKMINPEIVWRSEEENVYSEGCLSFPGQYADVVRPASIRIRYLDEQGKAQEVAADGLFATCFQHELDHLDGITFTDHLTRMKRDMIHRKLLKQQKPATV